MNKNNYYYDIDNDITSDDYWCYIIIGGRNTGKTYGALKDCYLKNRRFVFGKRTMDDVDLLMSGDEFGADMSPYAPINRDKHTNIHPVKLRPGFGAFYNFVDDKPEGKPVCYVFSLSAVHKFKGFDMSDCDYMIFDEFILY